MGDSLILLESPIQGAAMTSRIREGVQHLRSRCSKVVVVAHSQGAAVAERALIDRTDLPPIDALITVGSGIKTLEEERRARELGLMSWLPPIALVVTAMLALWLRADLQAATVELWRLAAAFGSLLGLIILVSLLIRFVRRFQERTRQAIIVLFLLAMVGAFFVAARFVGVWFFRTYVLLAAPASLRDSFIAGFRWANCRCPPTCDSLSEGGSTFTLVPIRCRTAPPLPPLLKKTTIGQASSRRGCSRSKCAMSTRCSGTTRPMFRLRTTHCPRLPVFF
jgi:pimeloyl-ACP methyl ester carboxylesterase